MRRFGTLQVQLLFSLSLVFGLAFPGVVQAMDLHMKPLGSTMQTYAVHGAHGPINGGRYSHWLEGDANWDLAYTSINVPRKNFQQKISTGTCSGITLYLLLLYKSKLEVEVEGDDLLNGKNAMQKALIESLFQLEEGWTDKDLKIVKGGTPPHIQMAIQLIAELFRVKALGWLPKQTLLNNRKLESFISLLPPKGSHFAKELPEILNTPSAFRNDMKTLIQLMELQKKTIQGKIAYEIFKYSREPKKNNVLKNENGSLKRFGGHAIAFFLSKDMVFLYNSNVEEAIYFEGPNAHLKFKDSLERGCVNDVEPSLFVYATYSGQYNCDLSSSQCCNEEAALEKLASLSQTNNEAVHLNEPLPSPFEKALNAYCQDRSPCLLVETINLNDIPIFQQTKDILDPNKQTLLAADSALFLIEKLNLDGLLKSAEGYYLSLCSRFLAHQIAAIDKMYTIADPTKYLLPEETCGGALPKDNLYSGLIAQFEEHSKSFMNHKRSILKQFYVDVEKNGAAIFQMYWKTPEMRDSLTSLYRVFIFICQETKQTDCSSFENFHMSLANSHHYCQEVLDSTGHDVLHSRMKFEEPTTQERLRFQICLSEPTLYIALVHFIFRYAQMEEENTENKCVYSLLNFGSLLKLADPIVTQQCKFGRLADVLFTSCQPEIVENTDVQDSLAVTDGFYFMVSFNPQESENFSWPGNSLFFHGQALEFKKKITFFSVNTEAQIDHQPAEYVFELECTLQSKFKLTRRTPNIFIKGTNVKFSLPDCQGNTGAITTAQMDVIKDAFKQIGISNLWHIETNVCGKRKYYSAAQNIPGLSSLSQKGPADGRCAKQDDGTPKYIQFASQSFAGPQSRYSATKKELVGVLYALTKFSDFLQGRHFTLYTDHRALTYYFTKASLADCMERYLCDIMEFDFDVVHRPGVLNVLPDALSRLYPDSIQESYMHKMRNRTTPNVNHVDSQKHKLSPKAFLSSTDWKLNPHYLTAFSQQYGPYDIDLFASAVNCQMIPSRMMRMTSCIISGFEKSQQMFLLLTRPFQALNPVDL
eukprot:Nk52_evm14s283 gene=Nk52_evmTU14s283